MTYLPSFKLPLLSPDDRAEAMRGRSKQVLETLRERVPDLARESMAIVLERIHKAAGAGHATISVSLNVGLCAEPVLGDVVDLVIRALGDAGYDAKRDTSAVQQAGTATLVISWR